MIMFKGHCQFIPLKNGDVLIKGQSQHILKSVTAQGLQFLCDLVDGVSEDSISDHIALIHELEKHNMLIRYKGDYDGTSSMSRQIDYLARDFDTPSNVQKNLSHKRIMVIGCGGTGAMVTQALWGHGFRHFIFIDGDVVQENNLNRQLVFNQYDLKKDKVLALKRATQAYDPSIEVVTEKLFIESARQVENLVKKYSPDFIVCGADTPPIKIQSLILEGLKETEVPVIFGGIGIGEASVGPLLQGERAGLEYKEFLDVQLAQIQWAHLKPVRGSLASTNALGANFMALDIFRFFTLPESCQSLNHRIIFDFESWQIKKKVAYGE